MKRQKDNELRALVRSMPCMGCMTDSNGKSGQDTQCAHIKTWKTTQLDIEKNLIPLCFKHHREQHDKGWEHMIKTYPSVEKYLELMGWSWKRVMGKFYLFNEEVK